MGVGGAAVVGEVLDSPLWGGTQVSAALGLSPRSAEPHVCCLSLVEVTSLSLSRTVFYHCCANFDGQTYRPSARSPILLQLTGSGPSFLTRIFHLTCSVTQLKVPASLGFMITMSV